MSKLKFFLLLMLLIAVVLVVFSFNNQSQNTIDKYKHLQPAEIVKIYWQAAFEGDEKIIRQIVTRTPKSFVENCKENNQIDKKESGISLLENKELEPDLVDTNEPTSSVKFMREATYSSDLVLAYATARFIYTSKIPLSQVTFQNERIFDDESVVETEYSISNYHSRKQNFFLVNEDGWKIFLATPPESATITNENYAKSRPKCEQ